MDKLHSTNATPAIASAIEQDGGIASSLRANDVLEILPLVERGTGKSFFPEFAARDNVRLCSPPANNDSEEHTRELWLLVHPSLRTLPHIDAPTHCLEIGIREAL